MGFECLGLLKLCKYLGSNMWIQQKVLANGLYYTMSVTTKKNLSRRLFKLIQREILLNQIKLGYIFLLCRYGVREIVCARESWIITSA